MTTYKFPYPPSHPQLHLYSTPSFPYFSLYCWFVSPDVMSSTVARLQTARSSPKKILLPDLVSHCNFKLRINRHRKQVTTETKKWLFKDGNLMGKKRSAYHGLKAGLLTSMCYPDAGYGQLRVVNDFLTYLFHLDNLSDDMDNVGTLSTADEVLNSLHHPYKYRSSARVGKMTRE